MRDLPTPMRDRRRRMTTEQQIKSAIDSLNEAMQALRELGLMTEEEEE
jgi:hypothetical protein